MLPDENVDGPSPEWSSPTQLFGDEIRLTVGDKLHAIGVTGGVTQHRSSADEGSTWSAPSPITGAGELPIYGPVAAAGSNVYVVTRVGGALHVQRSVDEGRSWSPRITLQGYNADNDDRVQMAAEGASVHIFVGRAGATPDGTFKIYYWRSLDAAQSFGSVQLLDESMSEPPSPGGIAVENGVVHVGYAAITDVGTLGHRARYLRSSDNGTTWSAPVNVSGPGSNPQIRPRPRALNGSVFVLWEEPLDHDRSRPYPNATRSEIRFNVSRDGGLSWQGPSDLTALPDVYVNHPEFAIGPDARVHAIYRMSIDQATVATADALGYRLSSDLAATWESHEVAMDDPSQETHPYGIVTTDDYAHAASSNGLYARRALR